MLRPTGILAYTTYICTHLIPSNSISVYYGIHALNLARTVSCCSYKKKQLPKQLTRHFSRASAEHFGRTSAEQQNNSAEHLSWQCSTSPDMLFSASSIEISASHRLRFMLSAAKGMERMPLYPLNSIHALQIKRALLFGLIKATLANNITLRGVILEADCRKTSGMFVSASINLDERITNNNGVLKCNYWSAIPTSCYIINVLYTCSCHSRHAWTEVCHLLQSGQVCPHRLPQ